MARKSLHRKWSVTEIARLLSARRQRKTYKECALSLGCTFFQVGYRLRRLRATKKSSTRDKFGYEILWKRADLEKVRRLYPYLSASAIAVRLVRTPNAVRNKVRALGLRKQREGWCYADVLRLLRSTTSIQHLRLSAPRTRKAISAKKRRLLLHFLRGRLDECIANASGAPTSGAVRFGRTFPPGLHVGSLRLSRRGKEKRARMYLTREAERERQKAAIKKWQARQPRNR